MRNSRERKIQVCPVCGKSNNRELKGGYCRKHNHQLKKYGYIKDNNPSTVFEPNEFKTEDEVSYVLTKDVLGNNSAIFKFDTEDLEKVKRYKWRCGKDGYCCSGYSSLRLHRLVMNIKEGGQVDHINGDITDNRKSNLRLATNALNQANKKPYNTSGLKGVSLYNSKKYGLRYHAIISRETTTFHSPVFRTPQEACYARYLMELWLWQGIYIEQHNKYTISDIERQSVLDKMKSIKNKIDNWLLSHNLKE